MNKDKKTKNILKKLENSEKDKEFLRELRFSLVEYIKVNPPVGSNYKYLWGWVFNLGKISFVVFLILVLVGSGTTLASQNSLPGETFYPIKMLTEKLILAAPLSSETRSSVNINLADRRIKEIQDILNKNEVEGDGGKVTKAIEIASNNLNYQLDSILKEGNNLKVRGDLAKSAELNSELKVITGFYDEVIDREIKNRKLGDELDKIASSAGYFYNEASKEIININKLENEKDGKRETAERKINESKGKIEEMEKIIKDKEGKISEKVLIKSREKLRKTKLEIDKANGHFGDGEFSAASQKAIDAIDDTNELRALIKISFDNVDDIEAVNKITDKLFEKSSSTQSFNLKSERNLESEYEDNLKNKD